MGMFILDILLMGISLEYNVILYIYIYIYIYIYLCMYNHCVSLWGMTVYIQNEIFNKTAPR